MRRYMSLILIALFIPVSAQAWWNEEWKYRKEITLDTSAAGANITESLENIPLLARLHTGNFAYFLDLMPKGEDIRFVAADDLTPLSYHIEHFDPINEMALIWVQIPELQASANTRSIWMYYGNPNAVAADNVAGTFDTHQTMVYHFLSDEPVPKDATAYSNHISQFSAELSTVSIMGGGIAFNGQNGFVVPDSPSLGFEPDKGWSWSAWVKIEAQQTEALLFERIGQAGRLTLGIDGMAVFGEFSDTEGNRLRTPSNNELVAGSWHHVALVLSGGRMALYLDGNETAYLKSEFPALQGDISFGVNAEQQQGFVGEMDEMRISNMARNSAWLQAIVKSQGQSSSLLVYGDDGAQEGSAGETSYFAITLHNVTVDGWVVIVMLAVMSAISWLVMISKGIAIARVRKDNAVFQEKFAELSAGEIDDLDSADTEEERQLRDSPLLMALSGKHEHFESSTLYRIYHSGVQEMHHRMAKSVGAQASYDLELSPQAIGAIRATMDGILTRENQHLNSQMVLLTIAISGGPFLGLLGTVVGVMITFAAIAASGDVNVNAIAPGIAAALVATVAGLAVAIPALFGYNYLGTRIKEISADMHVFVDEFVAKIAEQHS